MDLPEPESDPWVEPQGIFQEISAAFAGTDEQSVRDTAKNFGAEKHFKGALKFNLCFYFCLASIHV